MTEVLLLRLTVVALAETIADEVGMDGTSRGEHRTIADYFTPTRMLGTTAFCKKYPHPFLLGREVLEESFSFATAIARPDDSRSPQQEILDIRDWVIPVAAGGKGKRVFVGRSSNNDITIPHATVSKLHAYFTQEEDSWWIVDVGSSNGTRVGGVPVPARSKTPVKDDDAIAFGRCVFGLLMPGTLHDLVQRMDRAMDGGE